jgi:hypothetical protein
MTILKTFIRTLGVIAAMGAFSSVSAAVITGATGSAAFGSHAFAPAAETGVGVINGQGTTFTHQWLFSIASVADGSGAAIANQLVFGNVQTIGINSGLVKLYSDIGVLGAGGGDLLIGSPFSFNSSVQGSQNYPALAAGNYFYEVTGVTSGTAGGNYLLNSTFAPSANVPVPAGLALMVAGGIGLVAVRRKVAAKNN